MLLKLLLKKKKKETYKNTNPEDSRINLLLNLNEEIFFPILQLENKGQANVK